MTNTDPESEARARMAAMELMDKVTNNLMDSYEADRAKLAKLTARLHELGEDIPVAEPIDPLAALPCYISQLSKEARDEILPLGVRWVDGPIPCNPEKDITYGTLLARGEFHFQLNDVVTRCAKPSRVKPVVEQLRSVVPGLDPVLTSIQPIEHSIVPDLVRALGGYKVEVGRSPSTSNEDGFKALGDHVDMHRRSMPVTSAQGYPVRPKPAPRVPGADFVHDPDKKKVNINWIKSADDIFDVTGLYAVLEGDSVYLFYRGQEAFSAAVISSVLAAGTELVCDSTPVPETQLVQPDWDPLGLYVDQWGGPPPPEVVAPIVVSPQTRVSINDRAFDAILRISPVLGWMSGLAAATFTNVGGLLTHHYELMFSTPFLLAFGLFIGRVYGTYGERPTLQADKFAMGYAFMDVIAMAATPSVTWAAPAVLAQIAMYVYLVKRSNRPKGSKCGMCLKRYHGEHCMTPDCRVQRARKRAPNCCYCKSCRCIVDTPLTSRCAEYHPRKLRFLPGSVVVDKRGRIKPLAKTCPKCQGRSTCVEGVCKNPISNRPVMAKCYYCGATTSYVDLRYAPTQSKCCNHALEISNLELSPATRFALDKAMTGPTVKRRLPRGRTDT